MKGWYFSESSKRLRYGDDREIAIGVTHEVKGDPILCKHGLHASRRLFDAIANAPGPVVWYVELGGKIVTDDGTKHAAQKRTYLAGGIDISDILRAHARWCALQVAHLWDCPPVVRAWLGTGDESKRDAAGNAARSAAGNAAWSAARSAAWSAAWNVAWSAAESAARSAAESAARSAAWSAARSAAESAARSAAWSAMRAKQERHLLKLVRAAIEVKGGES